MHDAEAATQARTIIKEGIEATADLHEPTEEAILTGYVLVAEWVDPNGDKFLSTTSYSGRIDRNGTPWTVKGWLHETLFPTVTSS